MSPTPRRGHTCSCVSSAFCTVSHPAAAAVSKIQGWLPATFSVSDHRAMQKASQFLSSSRHWTQNVLPRPECRQRQLSCCTCRHNHVCCAASLIMPLSQPLNRPVACRRTTSPRSWPSRASASGCYRTPPPASRTWERTRTVRLTGLRLVDYAAPIGGKLWHESRLDLSTVKPAAQQSVGEGCHVCACNRTLLCR